MRREDAVPALDIYKRAVEQVSFVYSFNVLCKHAHFKKAQRSNSSLLLQAQRLSDFFEMCRSLDFGQSQKYVKIEQVGNQIPLSIYISHK